MLKRGPKTKPNPMIYTVSARVKPDLYVEIMKVAAKKYEGNISLLFREMLQEMADKNRVTRNRD